MSFDPNDPKSALLKREDVKVFLNFVVGFANISHEFDKHHFDAISPEKYISLCETEISKCQDSRRRSKLEAKIFATRHFEEHLPATCARLREFSAAHHRNVNEAMNALLIGCIAVVDGWREEGQAAALDGLKANLEAMLADESSSPARFNFFGLGDFALPVSPMEI